MHKVNFPYSNLCLKTIPIIRNSWHQQIVCAPTCSFLDIVNDKEKANKSGARIDAAFLLASFAARYSFTDYEVLSSKIMKIFKVL